MTLITAICDARAIDTAFRSRKLLVFAPTRTGLLPFAGPLSLQSQAEVIGVIGWGAWEAEHRNRVDAFRTKRPRWRWCAMTWFVVVLALSMVWIFLCGVVGDLADKKDHDGILWFFFSLFCSPLLGFLFVGLLPSAADLMPVGHRLCPHCSRTVKVGRKTCPYCNTDLSGKAKVGMMAA